MQKLLLTLCCVALAQAAVPAPRINCQECIDEMHSLSWIVKNSANDIEEFLKANYCPTLPDQHAQDSCVRDLANNYVAMLQMIVNHFFVDGANHICMAWGVCHPFNAEQLIHKEPRPFTCPECVEGMEWVEAYMTDPLWVAEYTVYLEQNYCVGTHDPHCVDMVQRHFPPMHAMAMTLFVPQDVCNTYSGACGATKPPM